MLAIMMKSLSEGRAADTPGSGGGDARGLVEQVVLRVAAYIYG